MTSTAMVATVGDARQYRKSRQMAAGIGLTPRQNSSGDKHRLLGISKRGDVYLRTLMIHGARSVVTGAKHKDDPLSRWVTEIAQRRHPNVAAVALANKNARMAWAMLRNKTDYNPDFAVTLRQDIEGDPPIRLLGKLFNGKQVEPRQGNPVMSKYFEVREAIGS